ncbi:MAG: PD-(D/E)XK nuclease family protein [Candidatus Nanopelagicales bacterium]
MLQAKEILERAAQSSPAQPELTAEETTLVNGWDAAIEYLVKEIEANTNPIKKVQVPTNLNVTKTIDLMKDPEGFAKELLRPMPAKPFVQTKRGTQFHLWVENFYKQSGLWDPYDLPGADAQDSLDETELKLMQENFKNSSWAQLKPLEVEWDFDIKIANRFIKGRVDAVFKIENKILIVDWKTGQKENSNPLQLAIYRLAWFNRFATDLADISAAFVYLPSLEKVEPDYLPNLAEIEELFINA